MKKLTLGYVAAFLLSATAITISSGHTLSTGNIHYLSMNDTMPNDTSNWKRNYPQRNMHDTTRHMYDTANHMRRDSTMY